MKKSKYYRRVRFSADVLKEAISLSGRSADETWISSDINTGSESWEYDNDEEFFAAYRRNPKAAYYVRAFKGRIERLAFSVSGLNTDISVSGRSASNIETIFEVFERSVEVPCIPGGLCESLNVSAMSKLAVTAGIALALAGSAGVISGTTPAQASQRTASLRFEPDRAVDSEIPASLAKPQPPELSRAEREALDNYQHGRPYIVKDYNAAKRKLVEKEKYDKERNKPKRNK
jgi:hypothetical protein